MLWQMDYSGVVDIVEQVSIAAPLDGDAQGGFNGVFTALPRPVTEEMSADPVGSPGTMSFIDDFTLTGGVPDHGNRFYRIQVVP